MIFAPALHTTRYVPRAVIEQDDQSWTMSLDAPGLSTLKLGKPIPVSNTTELSVA